MAIAINSSELLTVLEVTPSWQNIMLTGRHGIGKSQILTKYFEAKGMMVKTLFLGQMSDPGDLLGLPHKDEATGKTTFMPPYWFPMDGKPIVLFLDELNRARPEILQTVMDLVLNRKLAGRPLPEGSRIISACNDGEEYQLTDLDPALVSRLLRSGCFGLYVQDWTSEWSTLSVPIQNCSTAVQIPKRSRAWRKILIAEHGKRWRDCWKTCPILSLSIRRL